ncbi:MAG: hypothetical protein IAE93_15270 [Ignavibacteria bacterium]|nr:hypothetical protein [Ignavibacteria bacterium]
MTNIKIIKTTVCAFFLCFGVISSPAVNISLAAFIANPNPGIDVIDSGTTTHQLQYINIFDEQPADENYSPILYKQKFKKNQ